MLGLPSIPGVYAVPADTRFGPAVIESELVSNSIYQISWSVSSVTARCILSPEKLPGVQLSYHAATLVYSREASISWMSASQLTPRFVVFAKYNPPGEPSSIKNA